MYDFDKKEKIPYMLIDLKSICNLNLLRFGKMEMMLTMKGMKKGREDE